MTTLAGHEEDWIDTIPADRLKRLLDSGVKLFLVRSASGERISAEQAAWSTLYPEYGITKPLERNSKDRTGCSLLRLSKIREWR
jgi:hypothetical protein